MSMLYYLFFLVFIFLRYQIIAIQSLNVQNVLVYPSIRRARIFCITIKYRRWHFANIYVYEKAFRTETNLQTEGKGIHKFMLYFATLEYFGKRYILEKIGILCILLYIIYQYVVDMLITIKKNSLLRPNQILKLIWNYIFKILNKHLTTK